ncbi:hypothetical protein [Kitasatospora sp. NPDC087271]|uniref:hypothetical protein n=1 Tax=Kitasatospora sp. NPDC087271 TaxID=3364067 RepID=UPI00382272E8
MTKSSATVSSRSAARVKPGDVVRVLLGPQDVRVVVADRDQLGPVGGEQAGKVVFECLVSEADDRRASFHGLTPSAS